MVLKCHCSGLAFIIENFDIFDFELSPDDLDAIGSLDTKNREMAW